MLSGREPPGRNAAKPAHREGSHCAEMRGPAWRARAQGGGAHWRCGEGPESRRTPVEHLRANQSFHFPITSQKSAGTMSGPNQTHGRWKMNHQGTAKASAAQKLKQM